MRSVLEIPATPAKYQKPEGTWIQVTFTLDPAQYHILWERAEAGHLTVPDLVRESVVAALRLSDCHQDQND